MHRYDELEKLYYKKKLLKLSLILFIFLLLIFGIFFLFFKFNQHKKNTENKKINYSKNKIVKKDNKNIVNNKINEKSKIKKENNIDNNITYKKNILNKLSFILPKLDSKDLEIVNEQINNKEKNITNNKEKKSSPQIDNISEKDIKIQESRANVNALINQFNISPNYDLAITISKYFYNHKNYKKSQIWAIKANNIDPAKADSWILFADILLKEGKKNKAKKILSVYIDQYGNNDKIIKKLRSISE